MIFFLSGFIWIYPRHAFFCFVTSYWKISQVVFRRELLSVPKMPSHASVSVRVTSSHLVQSFLTCLFPPHIIFSVAQHIINITSFSFPLSSILFSNTALLLQGVHFLFKKQNCCGFSAVVHHRFWRRSALAVRVNVFTLQSRNVYKCLCRRSHLIGQCDLVSGPM